MTHAFPPRLRKVFKKEAGRQPASWLESKGGEEHTGTSVFQFLSQLKLDSTLGFLLALSSPANSELPHTGGTTEERQ